MRRSSKALLAATLAAFAAPARAKSRGYAPQIARLLADVQKESVQLVGEELLRQAERLDLGSMRVLLPAQMSHFKKRVETDLTMDSDVIEEYRRAITDMSPGDAPDIDKLIAEIRRDHALSPGPSLQRVALPAPSGKAPKLLKETGAGADVDSAIKGAPPRDEPAASAEPRFDAADPFLRRSGWSLDFYLGAFSDLAAYYRKLGYRRAYRLRAPCVNFGRSAYVLSPKPGLRPRLLYCEFFGQDLFFHTRVQWAELPPLPDGEGPAVATLACPACSWTLPGVKAMRALLATVPYTADVVIAGYDSLFTDLWEKRLLGVYENDYWRLAYYRNDAGVVATLQARRTDFGEILAAALTPLVRRGASAVYFAGPATAIDPGFDGADLVAPTGFVTFEGNAILSFENALARRRKAAQFSELPSPLLATREWLTGAKDRGVVAFDGEMSRIAEESGRWSRPDGGAVDVGIGAVFGGKESAKAQFRDAVLSALKDGARDKSR